MTRARQIANCHADAAKFRWQGLPGQFEHPSMAEAQEHLAALPAERRAQLNAEWVAGKDGVEEALFHLASLSPERRAQLQAEWK